MTKTYRMIALTLLLFLVSCQTVVDVDLPEEPSKLVVNAYFAPSERWSVSVSASAPILSVEDLESVNTAVVIVEDNDGNRIEFLPNPEAEGTYIHPSFPDPSRSYSITVSAPGFETVTAEGVTTTPVPVEEVDTARGISEEGFPTQEVRITFSDPAAQANYYNIKLYLLQWAPNPSGGDSIENIFEIPYTIPTDNLFGGGQSEDLFQDTPFNGKRFTVRVETDVLGFSFGEGGNPTDSLIAALNDFYLITELRTLSEDYFLYETTLDRYLFSANDPFSQPAQVYNNVDEGFGIFAGFSSSFDTLKIN